MAPRRDTAGEAKGSPSTSKAKSGFEKRKYTDNKPKGTGRKKVKTEDKANAILNPINAGTEATPKRKRNTKKKKEKFMEDDLLTPAQKSDKTRRNDRWIPDIGFRKRVATRPDSVPQELWMSYCMMDAYIYRESLSAEEVSDLPLIDEVFSYKQDGPKPTTPTGFCWDDEKELVPVSTLQYSAQAHTSNEKETY